jgi:hypothetical protein
MENLKAKLEKALEEHQRESGLHVIGGRARLVERLLQVLDEPYLEAEDEEYRATGGRCA